MKSHHYQTEITWTGNTGSGTSEYRSYERSHQIKVDGKPTIEASSDPIFRGDSSKYNPEELFLASISSCHMLWFLHLCAANHIVVTHYKDSATGTMQEYPDGSGRFTEVILHPEASVAEKEMVARAEALHHQANRMCFIANSCNFKVTHNATTTWQPLI